jgi:hypothetical protein
LLLTAPFACRFAGGPVLARTNAILTPMPRWPEFTHHLLSDEDVQAMEADLDARVMGPIMRKYVEQLLADRKERVRREAALMELLEKQGEELRSLDE